MWSALNFFFVDLLLFWYNDLVVGGFCQSMILHAFWWSADFVYSFCLFVLWFLVVCGDLCCVVVFGGLWFLVVLAIRRGFLFSCLGFC